MPRRTSVDRSTPAGDRALPRPAAVAPCPLSELAARAGAALEDTGTGTGGDAGAVAVTGVTHASDAVCPGDLYAALPGARRHGAEFVPAAAAAGAVAVFTDRHGAAAAAAAGLPALVVADPRAVLGPVAARVYGDPTRQLPVIGVTGTAGKTTTAYLVEAGLRAGGYTPGLLGTVETRLGALVVDSVRTTPEATDLHALFARARELGVDAVVMEVSSHALALDRVGGVRFAVGGWTNFGLDHLDFHPDADAYFAAKARLFDGRCGLEILNADVPALAPLRRPHTVTYSAAGDTSATWYATDRAGDGYRQRFTAHGPAGPVAAGVGLPGEHNVANALLALAALDGLGVPPAAAAEAVADCPGVPGRMERVDAPDDVLGVVDYAHKPDAIVAVLAALRPVVARRRGRLICVIGAGGERDPGKRPVMGRAAAEGADVVVVTDDNPRGEDPARIRHEVSSGASEAGRATVMDVGGRREALARAARLATAGDVVAVLGKGHERGQEVAGEVYPFDDREELAEALEQRGIR